MKRTAFLTSTCTMAAALACTTALAQPTHDARARYEEERRACMTQNTQDSQATCLREASAARDAAAKGQLSSPGAAAQANARERCKVFQEAADQAECVRRLDSTASGSVAGGGLLRESVTTTYEPR